MIRLNFNIESPTSTRQKLEAGYRARRNARILELFSMIVYQTPRKTGAARGEWQISIGAAPMGLTGRKDYDGGDVILAELSKLKGSSPFSRVHIGNNISYIDDLENGTSGQAPFGIVRVVIPAFRSMHGDVE